MNGKHLIFVVKNVEGPLMCVKNYKVYTCLRRGKASKQMARTMRESEK